MIIKTPFKINYPIEIFSEEDIDFPTGNEQKALFERNKN